MLSVKRQRQAEERRRQAGLVLTSDQAATRIQSALRGMIFRRKVGTWVELAAVLKPSLAIAAAAFCLLAPPDTAQLNFQV